MERSQNFLATENVGRLMQKYAVPCVISLLVGALYNIVDQILSQTQAISAHTETPQTR